MTRSGEIAIPQVSNNGQGHSGLKFDIEIPTCREGIFVPTAFARPEEHVRVIQEAERLGYHAVWGTDFITPTPHIEIPDAQPPNWYEVLITLAYAAAVTERIKLATGVILLPYRDPVILAKQAATLDQFSGGRLILGLGLGSREEFDVLYPKQRGAHRGKMMDEKVEALQLLLSHDKGEVSFKGQYVEFEGVNLHPKPVQNPLPIYVPGRSPDAVRRVARLGLGFMIRSSDARERLDALRPAMEEYGRDLSEVDIVAEAQLSLARSHDAAVERYRNSRLGFRNKGQDVEVLVSSNWIGTPEEVAENINKTKSEGISHFLPLHIAGDTVEERLEQMQMFAEDVIPNCT